jgi:hypothetical protein
MSGARHIYIDEYLTGKIDIKEYFTKLESCFRFHRYEDDSILTLCNHYQREAALCILGRISEADFKANLLEYTANLDAQMKECFKTVFSKRDECSTSTKTP